MDSSITAVFLPIYVEKNKIFIVTSHIKLAKFVEYLQRI